MSKTVIKTYDPKKDKMVKAGILDGDTFYKNVNSKHFMRKEAGYGISHGVIVELELAGCEHVVIKSKTKTYSSLFLAWLHAPLKNYGSGLQKFVPVRLMREVE